MSLATFSGNVQRFASRERSPASMPGQQILVENQVPQLPARKELALQSDYQGTYKTVKPKQGKNLGIDPRSSEKESV